METILAGAVIKKLYFYFFDFLGDFLGQISNLQKNFKKSMAEKNRKKNHKSYSCWNCHEIYLFIFDFKFWEAFLGQISLFESAPPPKKKGI